MSCDKNSPSSPPRAGCSAAAEAAATAALLSRHRLSPRVTGGGLSTITDDDDATQDVVVVVVQGRRSNRLLIIYHWPPAGHAQLIMLSSASRTVPSPTLSVLRYCALAFPAVHATSPLRLSRRRPSKCRSSSVVCRITHRYSMLFSRPRQPVTAALWTVIHGCWRRPALLFLRTTVLGYIY